MIKTLFAHAMHGGMKAAKTYPSLRPLVRKGNNAMISLAYQTYRKKGEEGWATFWIPALKKYGEVRAPLIAKDMSIDINDPASIGTYHDWEDPIFGVTGHWETNEKGEAVRVETDCPICDHLNKITEGKGCPKFCQKVITAMEMSTGQALNDEYVVKIETLLTDGDKTCRFIHKMKAD